MQRDLVGQDTNPLGDFQAGPLGPLARRIVEAARSSEEEPGSAGEYEVIPSENPDVRAALDAFIGLPAAIRVQHPTAVTADQAEGFAKRARSLPPNPLDPKVKAVLLEGSAWLRARYAHLRREYSRLTKGKTMRGAAVLAGKRGGLTEKVAEVLARAWDSVKRGLRAVNEWDKRVFKKTLQAADDAALARGVDLAKPGEVPRLIARKAGEVATGAGRGLLEGLGLGGAAALLLLALLLFKNGG